MTEISMSVLNKIRKLLEDADGDGLREMVRVLAEALMNAEVDGLCGAGHGEGNPERVNHRNGYRSRRWDTRVGTIDLQIPRTRKVERLVEQLGLEGISKSQVSVIAKQLDETVEDFRNRPLSARRQLPLCDAHE